MTGFVQFRIVSSLGLAVVAKWNHGALPLGIEAVNHSLICIIALCQPAVYLLPVTAAVSRLLLASQACPGAR
ncbi:hypothetical protein QUA56_09365 [Microcoleus sp. N3A4]|uniref:hypothetical protein n=1 Tax=Microcoleus sp. N3A4 TaxID=3055379 RepID=UPI002FD0C531